MSKTIKNVKGDIFYRAEGTVKSFNKESGYGFIFTIDEPDNDIYVHATQVLVDGDRELKIGDRVEFLYRNFDNKGFRAYEVRLLDN